MNQIKSPHAKNLIKLSLISSAFFATGVYAKDGFYVGSTTSSATLSHSIERNTGSNESASITSFAQESDYSFGIKAGYRLSLSEDFFVAAEAFYTEEDITTTNLNNLLQTEITLNNTYGAKLKAGVTVTDKLSIYGLVGSTTLDFDIDNSYPFAPPMRSGSDDISEVALGLGAEFQLNEKFSLVAEYSEINDADFAPLAEVAVPGKINPNELDYSSLSFGVNYTF